MTEYIKITNVGDCEEELTLGKVYKVVNCWGQGLCSGISVMSDSSDDEVDIYFNGDTDGIEFDYVNDPIPNIEPQDFLYDESGSGGGVSFAGASETEFVSCYTEKTNSLDYYNWLVGAANESYDALVSNPDEERVLGNDPVNSPNHYGVGQIECIEYIKDFLTTEEYVGYLRGNIGKYMHRFRYKNGVEDLKKAEWYLKELINVYPSDE